GSQKQRVFSDAQGRYELTDIVPGEYVLWASAGDHRSTHLAQAFGEPEPMDPWSRTRKGLDIRAGDRRTDMNIVLARALAIEGMPTDPWAEPMANVRIELTRTDGRRASAPEAYSNDRGEFRAYGLRPGRYRVCVTPHTAGVPSADGARLIRTCYPSVAGGTGG